MICSFPNDLLNVSTDFHSSAVFLSPTDGYPLRMQFARNLWEGDALAIGDCKGHLVVARANPDCAVRIVSRRFPISTYYEDSVLSRPVHTGTITCLKWANYGTCFVDDVEHSIFTGSTDGSIAMFDVATEKVTCRLAAHRGWVNDLAFLPQQPAVVVTVGADGFANVWDIRKVSLAMGSTAVESSLRPHAHIAPSQTVNTYVVGPCDKSKHRKSLVPQKSCAASAVSFVDRFTTFASTATSDSVVRLFDLRRLKDVLKVVPVDERSFGGISWSSSDEHLRRFAVHKTNGRLIIHPCSSLLYEDSSKHENSIAVSGYITPARERHRTSSVQPCLSPDGSWLGVPTEQEFQIFNLSQLDPTRPVNCFSWPEEEACYLTCGSWSRRQEGTVAFAGDDGRICILRQGAAPGSALPRLVHNFAEFVELEDFADQPSPNELSTRFLMNAKENTAFQDLPRRSTSLSHSSTPSDDHFGETPRPTISTAFPSPRPESTHSLPLPVEPPTLPAPLCNVASYINAESSTPSVFHDIEQLPIELNGNEWALDKNGPARSCFKSHVVRSRLPLSSFSWTPSGSSKNLNTSVSRYWALVHTPPSVNCRTPQRICKRIRLSSDTWRLGKAPKPKKVRISIDAGRLGDSHFQFDSDVSQTTENPDGENAAWRQQTRGESVCRSEVATVSPLASGTGIPAKSSRLPKKVESNARTLWDFGFKTLSSSKKDEHR